jgi:hypothetical protein
MRPVLEAYIVRIYRRAPRSTGEPIGTVERVGSSERVGFAGREELLKRLAAPRRGRDRGSKA